MPLYSRQIREHKRFVYLFGVMNMKKQGYQPEYPVRTLPPDRGSSVQSYCKCERTRGGGKNVSECFCRICN